MRTQGIEHHHLDDIATMGIVENVTTVHMGGHHLNYTVPAQRPFGILGHHILISDKSYQNGVGHHPKQL